MLARKDNFSMSLSYVVESSSAPPQKAIREAKPRSVRPDDRAEMRKGIMNRYEKTLAYLAK